MNIAGARERERRARDERKIRGWEIVEEWDREGDGRRLSDMMRIAVTVVDQTEPQKGSRVMSVGRVDRMVTKRYR